MHTNQTIIIPITALLMLIVIGCDKDRDKNRKLAEMAERHSQRQAEQNQRTVELQREVATGTRRLVEADAKARTEMVKLHRDVQAERTEVGRQRDALEKERRGLATARRLHPIIASAITNIGLLLACLLPLVLCIYLLNRPVEAADDQAVAELLLEDLVAERPLLTHSNDRQRIGLEVTETASLAEEGEPPNDSN